VSVWAAAYVAFAIAYRLRERTPPGWLCWLGRVSYSIYLVHTLFIVAVPATWPIYVYAPAVFGGTLLISALTYRFIEQPAIAFGRRFVTSPRPVEMPLRRAA
jgi:peptidoglycan/LPS O-acetylase OafA/YrhL